MISQIKTSKRVMFLKSLLKFEVKLLKCKIYDGSIVHGLPGGSVVNNLPADKRDVSLIPSSRRSPGEENGNPL